MSLKSMTVWVGGMCLLVAACSEPNMAPPSGPQRLTFTGVVTDSAGDPVEGALVVGRLWSDDSATAARKTIPYAITDTAGAFLLQSDTVVVSLVDSVLIQTVSPGCRNPRVSTSIPDGGLGEGGVQGITIIQADVPRSASNQSGLICAYGVLPAWGPLAYSMAMQFDVPGAAVLQGRWRITYQISSEDDFGSLVGALTGSFVQLDLTDENPSGACTSMRLFANIDSNGEWGPMRMVDQQGCVPDPIPFTFVEDSVLGFP